jgi:uncharacterized protein with ATP-grasp and redox domains
MDCLPCLLQQGIRTAREYLETEEEQRDLVKKIIGEMAAVGTDASAPFIAHKIQRVLKETIKITDPYFKEKQYYNREMLKLEDEFAGMVESADNPLKAALKLAAAGNIIDFGPGHDLSRDSVLQTVRDTMKKEYPDEVFQSFTSALKHADRLLYLGDNAGEIVFDKVFIRTIKAVYPQLQVYFATRGKPIINDVTENDAYAVKMDSHASIINNGTDIPGTILELCNDTFKEIFWAADVIISKGQGNFESLCGTRHPNLYYIFLCKCSLFTERFGVNQNDMVLFKE